VLDTVLLTLHLATLTTVILLIIGIPLGAWLAFNHRWYKEIINTLVALPLVLPPTVLGFYLLILLSPTSGVGHFLLEHFDLRLVFTFEGLVLGSVIYSLPFVVQPIKNAFESMGAAPLEMAATLGASKLDRFMTVGVPLARAGILTGAVLGFAHTLGEFGLVMMIGGNIPNETRVLSMAIYDHVEALEWEQAHRLSLGMLIGAFVLILTMNLIDRKLRWQK
jgi:molybdate transport system permease protein